MEEEHNWLYKTTGWISFFAWSLSFYGQLILNFKLKNVEGLKLEFQLLNLCGFTFYTMFTIKGKLDKGNENGLGDISIQDVLFAVHALGVTIVTCIQIIIYPRGKNKVSLLGWILFFGYISAGVIFAIIFWVYYSQTTNWLPQDKDFNYWKLLGYFKVSISTIKYTPQVYWNWLRKSTMGWSIFNILMDITGGVFSVAQNGVAIYEYGWEKEFNLVKFALGNLSIVFDLIFMLQHYVFYRNQAPINLDTPDEFAIRSLFGHHKESDIRNPLIAHYNYSINDESTEVIGNGKTAKIDVKGILP